jgi:hypothetical protein
MMASFPFFNVFPSLLSSTIAIAHYNRRETMPNVPTRWPLCFTQWILYRHRAVWQTAGEG